MLTDNTLCSFQYLWGVGGALVESTPFVRTESHDFDSRSNRHAGTLGKSFTHSCLCASAWNSGTVVALCRERLWVVVDLKRRY